LIWAIKMHIFNKYFLNIKLLYAVVDGCKIKA